MSSKLVFALLAALVLSAALCKGNCSFANGGFRTSMPVYKDALNTFPSQIYQRTESDREWPTLSKFRNHCENCHKGGRGRKRGLPGPHSKVGAEGCAGIFEES